MRTVMKLKILLLMKIIKNNNQNNVYIKNIFFCQVHNGLYLSKDDYETHAKTHRKCEVCGLEFKYKNELKQHRKTHNININNNVKDYKIMCTDCNLIFTSVELMSEHHFKIHNKIISNN